MCEHYQGWTNYETWLTDLWLNNEEYSYEVLCKAMRQPSLAYYVRNGSKNKSDGRLMNA